MNDLAYPHGSLAKVVSCGNSAAQKSPIKRSPWLLVMASDSISASMMESRCAGELHISRKDLIKTFFSPSERTRLKRPIGSLVPEGLQQSIHLPDWASVIAAFVDLISALVDSTTLSF